MFMQKLKIVTILVVFIMFMSTFSLANNVEIINPDSIEAVNDFKDYINTISTYIIAFAAVTSVLIFIVHFVRLASSYAHPMLRHKVLKEMFVSGICTALIGGIGLIFKIYVSIFM